MLAYWMSNTRCRPSFSWTLLSRWWNHCNKPIMTSVQAVLPAHVQLSGCQLQFTDNLCTYYTATCSKAISSPDTAYALFTGVRQEQCAEWIPKENGHPERDRNVTKDNKRYAVRMQKDGADYIGHLIVNTCYSRDGEGRFMDREDYPSQYLRIRDGCTVVFVNYEIGAPVPPCGLICGYTTEGLPVYIGLEHRNPRYGYYIAGSNSLVNADEFITGNVRLLVAL